MQKYTHAEYACQKMLERIKGEIEELNLTISRLGMISTTLTETEGTLTHLHAQLRHDRLKNRL